MQYLLFASIRFQEIPWEFGLILLGFALLIYGIVGRIHELWASLPRDRRVRALFVLFGNFLVVLGCAAMFYEEPPTSRDGWLWLILSWIIFGGFLVASDWVAWRKVLQPPEKLRFLVNLDKEELRVVEEIVKNFEGSFRDTKPRQAGVQGGAIEKQQHVNRAEPVRHKVELENVRSQEIAISKLKKERYDVVAFDITFRDELIRANLVAPITEEELGGHRLPQTWPALRKILDFDGRTYFFPFRPNVKIAFLNKAKFQELNEKAYGESNGEAPNLPKTWEQVLKVAKRFYDRDGKPRVGVMAKGIDAALLLLELIRSAGGDPKNLSDPRTQEAIQFAKELWKYIGPISAELTYNTVIPNLILQQNLYLTRSWAYQIKTLKEQHCEEQFLLFAGFRWSDELDPVYLLGGDLLAVCAKSRHKDLALQLIDYLVSTEVQTKLAEQLSWPPARTGVPVESVMGKDAANALSDALNFAKPTPSFWSMEMSKIFQELFEKTIVQQQVANETGLRDFQKSISHEIERQQNMGVR